MVCASAELSTVFAAFAADEQKKAFASEKQKKRRSRRSRSRYDKAMKKKATEAKRTSDAFQLEPSYVQVPDDYVSLTEPEHSS